MVTVTVDREDLVVTVRLPHAVLVEAAKTMCGKDAVAALEYVKRETIAKAIAALNHSYAAAQQTDAQIDEMKVAQAAELDAIKAARATVDASIEELLK